MRVLVVGGSWFVGTHLVAALYGGGHEVTVFNRGIARTEHPKSVRAIHGDWEKPDDIAALARAGPWDTVLDIAGSVPRVVRGYARSLAAAADRYVLVSTISAYRDWPYAPVDEESALWDGDRDQDPGTRAWDPGAYGPLKVGCELAVLDAFGIDRTLVLRPHVILGPGEYVGRLPWWLNRIARGGRVVAPAPDRAIQPVDVRDLAAFTVARIAANDTGTYNVAAPPGRETFGDLLAACRKVTGARVAIEWIDEQWLIDPRRHPVDRTAAVARAPDGMVDDNRPRRERRPGLSAVARNGRGHLAVDADRATCGPP